MFFPKLLQQYGQEVNGRPRACRFVPIFRSSVSTKLGGEDDVTRQQFPLVLAWALTHWKAQGMTLRRVRIRIGAKTAGTPGIGFVAVTRVKHPSHLVFEQDLPAFENFQDAQWKANFRSRRRYEWRLQAKGSETLCKYGYCGADEWTGEDAGIARYIFQQLKH